MNKKRVVIFSLVWLLLAGTCAGGYYYFYYYQPSQKQETVAKDVFSEAYTGEILSSIKVLWETNLLQEQKLKFNIEWNVVWVYVSEWKKVLAWELLAEIDKGQLQNELKEAQLNYENANINLWKIIDKLTGDDKKKELSALENQKRKIWLTAYDYNKLISDNETRLTDKYKQIEQTKLNLEKLQKDSKVAKDKLSSDISDQKTDLDYKKKTLSDEKWNIQKSILDEKKSLDSKNMDYNNTFINTYDGIENDITQFFDNLRTTNDYLRIDNEYKTISSNIYFSAKNISYKNEAENYYWWAKSAILTLEKEFKTWNKSTLTTQYLTKLLNLEKDVYDKLYTLWDMIVKWADNSIESESFLQSDISSIKSSGNSLRSTAYSSKKSIDDSILKLANLDTPNELQEKSRIAIEKLNKQLIDLEKDITKNQKDLDNLYLLLPEKIKEVDLQLDKETRAYNQLLLDVQDLKYKNSVALDDKKIEIQDIKQDYAIALKTFDKKYSNVDKNEEVLLQKNALKQAQIAIDQVNKKIESYEIRAPFDGVVDSFAMKVGDKLTNNATDEKFINLINPWVMEIKIKLDQIDVVKIKKWIEAQVTFDSYPDKVFTWVLWAPDSKPIDDNGMKKYQVKMIIDKWDLNIFSGMSANVDIVLDKVSDAILVPTMSIETDQNTGMSYVTLQKNAKKLKQTVEVWLNGNGVTQILSWVTVWDKVLEINFDANVFKPEDFVQPSYGWMPY